MAMKPAGEQLAEIGDRVLFDFDKFDLKTVGRARARDWANFLQANPTLVVTLEGNCDERGTREYNLALGNSRAQSVRDFLVGLGVDASRLTTISYGKERPVALGSNESAWGQNRNVHIAVN
jgi:peptidoglycan-associated lipoprotein